MRFASGARRTNPEQQVQGHIDCRSHTARRVNASVFCRLTAMATEGQVRNMHVLEQSSSTKSAQTLVSLQTWLRYDKQLHTAAAMRQEVCAPQAATGLAAQERDNPTRGQHKL